MQDGHVSMDTVFSIDSMSGHQRRPSSPATLRNLVAYVEQLQDEIRQKEVYISDLEGDSAQLRQMLDQANHQCVKLNLQLDIQNELLGRIKQTDKDIEQLRTAIIDRDAIIGEKERAVRAVERQLEHHKLLLQAEIRKHATTTRYLANEIDPLPDLIALAKEKDIDRWIQKLNQRLQKEKSTSSAKEPTTAVEAHVENLKNEIGFYVREIIYYKLDIRGYKSDIKKLKKITAQLGSHGNKISDLDSDTSSLRPAPTPSRARFVSMTPELKGSEHPSPVLTCPIATNMGTACALTPPPSTSAGSPNASPSHPSKSTRDDHLESVASRISMVPQTASQINMLNSKQESPAAIVPKRPDAQHSIGDSLYTSSKAPEIFSTSTHGEQSTMLTYAIHGPKQSPLQTYDSPNSPSEFSTSNILRTSLQAGNTIEATTRSAYPESDRPNLERDISEALTVRPVVPTSRFSRDSLASSPSPKPYRMSHSRVGSESSTLSYNLQHQLPSRPERKLSGASDSGIPFVIAMGSPHNPAIAVAAKNMPVTRANATHKAASTTSKAGIGGTMASSTPLLSPTMVESPPDMLTKSLTAMTGHKRKLSLSFRKQENGSQTTPTHTRSMSGGSIRTAIRWNKGSDKEKEKEIQLRQDNTSMPQPLGSPFHIDQSPSIVLGQPRAIEFGAVGNYGSRA